jgi:lipid II:glycine glycyltransferase (peptidoglycan interpeptide bridge formation enzyme)
LEQYVTHVLKIDRDPGELKKSFHKTTVQQRIRRAEKFNLKLEVSKDAGDIKIFYHLHTLNRKKIGLPPLPFTFFKNMYDILLPAGLMSLLLGKYNNDYISALILLKFKNCVYAEYLATDPESLKYNPNHFLWWKAIEMARDEGYTLLDLGRSSIDNHGLIDFKKRWAAEEKQLYYYYFPQRNSISAENRESLKFKAMNSICKRMPPKLLQVGGNIFYQYLN